MKGTNLGNKASATAVQPYKYNGKELDRTHGLDWYDYGARHMAPDAGRFTTIDPMAEKYYHLSPYAYCANNPVRYVDPNGTDIWDIDVNGNVVNSTKTDEYDMIRMVNSNQEIGASFEFKFGTINHQTIKNRDGSEYELFKINGDENGIGVFEMLAQNTNVEWTKAQIGELNGMNVITTSHEIAEESGFSHYISKNYKEGMIIRDITHNHPSGGTFPSFGDNRNNGDVPFARYIKNLTKQEPTFHIYVLDNGKYSYIKYGVNSKVADYILNGPILEEVTIKGKKR